jgi:hypothetical protein
MPIFMDRHDVRDATAEAVAAAHQEDLRVQAQHACKSLTYWYDEQRGTAFCLIEAPTAAAVRALHREAHGLIPNVVIEVNPSTVSSFLGRVTDPEGAAGEPIREGGFRAIMFTDMANSTLISIRSEMPRRRVCWRSTMKSFDRLCWFTRGAKSTGPEMGF